MQNRTEFDVLIIGGSYAGLSAAMALGRSLRNVLILDSGKPCNRQTPHSHNFLTQDGETPAAIAQKAREQVLAYPTVSFQSEKAIKASGQNKAFEVITDTGNSYTGSKLLFATGVADKMPPIKGFAESWGISALHCPYCHGYEVHHQPLGILADGDMAFEFVKLILNWSPNLTLLTNGKSNLKPEQRQVLQQHGVSLVEKEVHELVHQKGYLQQVEFSDGSSLPLTALFARLPFTQHCPIPEQLGCELTEAGLLKIDGFQQTSVLGIYAAGDATSPMRAVSNSVASGTFAGAALNKALIEERFK
ncbi:NAD(P)/FAD-dependent oxidoreductase [Rufibacter roseus]|uniref:NAD(P)/FAD-dependent oxidoreductase n=1 Tax=Rufibacter roseus TaxID=1567108 RepID=A0ABW2DIG3_9BACT|nr:NAD(P)/FAD-dependent oxidoreductase [Rufibacter roseus]